MAAQVAQTGEPFYPAGGGSGATTFTALTDAPASYAGQATKVVRVNALETGLEFAAGSVDPGQSTSLSQISSSLSGEISTDLSRVSSLSTAVSTVDSNQATSLSQTSSTLSGAISSTSSLSAAVSTVDSNQSTSLSQVSSSLSGAISSTSSLSSAVSTVDSNQSTSLSQISSSLSGAISSTSSLSTAVSTTESGQAIRTITFIVDGGGATITTGVKGYLEIPFGCTINRVTVLCDQSGSIVFDIWKIAYASYPPTVTNTITASAKPTVTTAVKAQDSTLTGWTTSIAAGDTLGFNVDSVTTCQRVTVSLKVTMT